MTHNKMLMLLCEPTPYILDLLATLESISTKKISVIFITENNSQDWNLIPAKNHLVLPKKKLPAIKKSVRLLFSEKYDVIFLAGWSHPVNIILLLLSFIKRIPVVMDSDTSHNKKTSFFKKIMKRVIYPKLFALPKRFLPAGTRQAVYLKKYGVPSQKIVIEKMTVNVLRIQNDIQTYSNEKRLSLRKQFKLDKNDFVFLFVGRLIERKGLSELISAFSRTLNPNAKLLIVGDGDCKSYIEIATKKDSRIIYAGRISPSEIIQLYFLSDVFVLPAHWEPWGLVINEAMAAGKPVIVTDQVGCADDLVRHQKTGLVIPSHSIDALYRALIFFLENPKQCEAMSQNALELISHWTLIDSARQIVSACDFKTGSRFL